MVRIISSRFPQRDSLLFVYGTLRPFEEILFATETLDTFREAQIKITWANGLELYVNHATSAWTRTIQSITYTIPEDGFVAVQPSSGFVSFSAIAPIQVL